MKVCKICEVEKPDDEYYERKKGSGKFFVFCKDCFRERQRRYHENNIEQERKRLRKYYYDKKKERDDFIEGVNEVVTNKKPEPTKNKISDADLLGLFSS
jgi:hypothetical protein